MYDTIIIGGAAAGLSAAMYTSRRALKTLVLSKTVGGQAATTTEIENYPGIESIKGPMLMMDFKKMAENSGAEFKIEEVLEIKKQEDNSFIVKTSKEEYKALSIILSFGLEHRKLNIPGEKELVGRGVAYCATCDGPFFRNKTVAVVGGGNSAFDAADYLGKLCEKVYLIHRREEFRAEQTLIDEVKKAKNIELVLNSEIKEIIGKDKVEKIKVVNNKTSEDLFLDVAATFIEIGYEAKTTWLKDLVALDEKGQIIIDLENKTSQPGIMAAGDVTITPFKQVVISAGEGAKAALSVARYLQKIKGEAEKEVWFKR